MRQFAWAIAVPVAIGVGWAGWEAYEIYQSQGSAGFLSGWTYVKIVASGISGAAGGRGLFLAGKAGLRAYQACQLSGRLSVHIFVRNMTLSRLTTQAGSGLGKRVAELHYLIRVRAEVMATARSAVKAGSVALSVVVVKEGVKIISKPAVWNMMESIGETVEGVQHIRSVTKTRNIELYDGKRTIEDIVNDENTTVRLPD